MQTTPRNRSEFWITTSVDPHVCRNAFEAREVADRFNATGAFRTGEALSPYWSEDLGAWLVAFHDGDGRRRGFVPAAGCRSAFRLSPLF